MNNKSLISNYGETSYIRYADCDFGKTELADYCKADCDITYEMYKQEDRRKYPYVVVRYFSNIAKTNFVYRFLDLRSDSDWKIFKENHLIDVIQRFDNMYNAFNFYTNLRNRR